MLKFSFAYDPKVKLRGTINPRLDRRDLSKNDERYFMCVLRVRINFIFMDHTRLIFDQERWENHFSLRRLHFRFCFPRASTSNFAGPITRAKCVQTNGFQRNRHTGNTCSKQKIEQYTFRQIVVPVFWKVICSNMVVSGQITPFSLKVFDVFRSGAS